MSIKENASYKSIPGWGIDADPEDTPTYPLTQKLDNSKGLSWHRPPAQIIDVEVLKSNERPVYPSVVGTTVPPRGLSGVIRRFAFRYSEDKLRHWMPLILADRINVVEGILHDLVHGRIPNIYKELGGPSELKYNPAGFTRKVIFVTLMFSLIVFWIVS